jgi:hypothetical protein
MDDQAFFRAVRKAALAALADRNRDERHNELVALKIQTESLSSATIDDPEDWVFTHAARRRIRALRQFLRPTPKP